MQSLVDQAVDKPLRYKPKQHVKLSTGDIVLLIEKHSKPSNYPLGIIKSVESNSNGEVTAARVMKGKTRETVYRHATSLILLVPGDTLEEKTDYKIGEPDTIQTIRHSGRASSLKAKALNKVLATHGLM